MHSVIKFSRSALFKALRDQKTARLSLVLPVTFMNVNPTCADILALLISQFSNICTNGAKKCHWGQIPDQQY